MGIFNVFKKKEGSENKKNYKNQFHAAEVVDVVQLTPNAVALYFKPKGNLDFSFEAGQYINFRFFIDGNEERRSYSLASSPEEEVLMVGVKSVEDGVVSNYINTQLKKGDVLEVSLPQGNFKLQEAMPENGSVAIAAGSGITPILSMLHAASSRNHSFTLLFGNKSEEDIMFKSTIDELAKKDTLNVHHFLSRTPADGFEQGRLEGATLKSFIKDHLDLLKSKGFYLCGPEAMIVEATDVLKEFGVNGDKINYELFTTPTLLKSEPEGNEGGHETVEEANVTAILDDETIEFTMNGNESVVLNKLLNLGYDAPFSCKGGVCCTCRAKIIEGTVKMDGNFALSDEEINEGYILTCQSRPTSKALKITYDE